MKDAYDRFIDEADGEYQVIRITPASVRLAAELTQRYPLKAYDAMQLAVGLRLNDLLKADDFSLVIVTGDDTLLQAAKNEGLATDNPFDHGKLDSTK